MSTRPKSHRTALLPILFAGAILVVAGGPPARAKAAAQDPKPDLAASQSSPGEPPAEADAVAFCWNTFEAGEWGKMTDCLRAALNRQESLLAEALAQATTQGAQSMDSKSAARTLKRSSARWVEYRDSECERQLAFVAGRNHPDIGELTCRIRQTAARIADLKFDE